MKMQWTAATIALIISIAALAFTVAQIVVEQRGLIREQKALINDLRQQHAKATP